MPVATGGLSSELAYLKALYRLTGEQTTRSVFYGDISRELGWTSERAEEAAYFWVDRGVLEWSTFGQVTLTRYGLKRAQRLAGHGWSLAAL